MAVKHLTFLVALAGNTGCLYSYDAPPSTMATDDTIDRILSSPEWSSIVYNGFAHEAGSLRTLTPGQIATIRDRAAGGDANAVNTVFIHMNRLDKDGKLDVDKDGEVDDLSFFREILALVNPWYLKFENPDYVIAPSERPLATTIAGATAHSKDVTVILKLIGRPTPECPLWLAHQNLAVLLELRGLQKLTGSDFTREVTAWCELLANSNDEYILQLIAGLFLDFEKSEQALACSVKLAGFNNPQCLFAVAYIEYRALRALGAKIDGPAILSRLDRAAATGSSNAQVELARHHFRGQIVPKNYTRGLQLVQAAADAKNWLAVGWLGQFNYYGFDDESGKKLLVANNDRGKQLLAEAAKQGDKISQKTLEEILSHEELNERERRAWLKEQQRQLKEWEDNDRWEHRMWLRKEFAR